MSRRKSPFLAFILFCISLGLTVHPAGAIGPDVTPGINLPSFALPLPGSPQHLDYLGLDTAGGTFTLSQVNSKYVIVDLFSATCKDCHKNAPILNRLFKVINEDQALNKDIKVIAVAVGNEQKLADAFQKQYKIPFPVFADPGKSVNKAIGLTGTPFLFMVEKDSSSVLMTHMARITDFDKLLDEIRTIHNDH